LCRLSKAAAGVVHVLYNSTVSAEGRPGSTRFFP
jgi:hypothetical protein